VVISSRNFWTTLTLQGYASGVDTKLIEKVTADFLPPRYLKPDYGVILTLPDGERKKRQSARDDHSAHDMFEQKAAAWQTRANRGYKEIAQQRQIPLIDASPSPEEIHRQIIKLLHF
jgi:thymidylate kinase